MTPTDANPYEISVLSNHSTKAGKGEQTTGFSQWWYFDALSDNGEDALVIEFIAARIVSSDATAELASDETSGIKRPVVSFEYYRKGKLLYRAACEYSADRSSSDHANGSYHIGNSHFELGSADYGSGYSLKLDLPIARGQRIKVGMEWLFIESDLLEPGSDFGQGNSIWNVVAPRADVTGKFEVVDKAGRVVDTCHFRGSGYHDHRSGPVNFLENFSLWSWGRIHFPDSTAIFLSAENKEVSISKLLVVRDNTFRVRDAICERRDVSHDLLGIKFEQNLKISSDDGLELTINRIKPLSSGIYMLRFICEMQLTLRDGKPRKSIGLSECISPKRLRSGWMRKLTGLFTNRNDQR
ncbi:MAG: hypothetical protein KF685_04380 [Acidobacteria bacterium]|nr:hypothetical protein [Acidobacteriota bacterium]